MAMNDETADSRVGRWPASFPFRALAFGLVAALYSSDHAGGAERNYAQNV